MIGMLLKGLGADKVLWGTDSVWYGSPQWQIESLRRLEIPEDMQRKHGFKPLGPADGPVKTAIFGANSAKMYKYDVKKAGLEVETAWMITNDDKLMLSASYTKTKLGALVAALPVTSLLVLAWLYAETHDVQRVATMSMDIFWFVLGGGAGALLFRLANTLDAMWGYRTPRHERFGWAAARIDDVLDRFGDEPEELQRRLDCFADVRVVTVAEGAVFDASLAASHGIAVVADRPGVAWSEDEYVVYGIKRAKEFYGADYVITYPHWGLEHRKIASPRQVHLARLMIDSGADAVVGGHPHVTQNVEVHKGKPIFYSLGNFVFNGFTDDDSNTGWLVQLFIKGDAVTWQAHEAKINRLGIPKYSRAIPGAALLP